MRDGTENAIQISEILAVPGISIHIAVYSVYGRCRGGRRIEIEVKQISEYIIGRHVRKGLTGIDKRLSRICSVILIHGRRRTDRDMTAYIRRAGNRQCIGRARRPDPQPIVRIVPEEIGVVLRIHSTRAGEDDGAGGKLRRCSSTTESDAERRTDTPRTA